MGMFKNKGKINVAAKSCNDCRFKFYNKFDLKLFNLIREVSVANTICAYETSDIWDTSSNVLHCVDAIFSLLSYTWEIININCNRNKNEM